MYSLEINEKHRKSLSRTEEGSIRYPYGGSGNVGVMLKLDKLASRNYDSLKEIVSVIISAGHLDIDSLEKTIEKCPELEISMWPIYQTSPKFLLGYITNLS